ncbi:alpha/beta hydrolase [Pseudorhizobium endolithicum]|uniref:Alpha/beta hydrolase n=1 Tax=Pseudorhizobium endolithicum TaxID=1191678 RepID=A0ABM8PHW8_9HYPH|nr:alpha/beta hydrolase-fold protein [Pseudorhizobium endolithicum]CAD7030945.1 alpha/beta hydrolase [Pseudorhizobium endolithicum]
MQPSRRAFLAALPFVALALGARAEIKIPEVKLDILKQTVPTHRLDVADVTLSDGGAFRLFRAVPVQAAPPAGYRALYMLDGNGAFDVLTPQLLGAAQDVAIFGIGYPTNLRFEVNRRSLDYTPSLDGKGPVPDPQRPERQIGGADTFLAMLTGELRRLAEANVPVDPGRRFLWGHSYGGLFALHTLLTGSSAFAGYAAISPSVWWGGSLLQEKEKMFELPAGEVVPLLVALGDREQRSDDKTPPKIGPAPATMDLVRRLRRHHDLSLTVTVLEGMGHGATFAASIPSVLDWVSRAG